MEREYLLLENYRIFTDSKERFIDRSFASNKFYLVLDTVLLIIAAAGLSPDAPMLLTAIVSALGMLIAMMWWFNQDSYDYLIKIKYQKVLEHLEEQMGVETTKLEARAQREDAKKRKLFVFCNTHKSLSLLVFVVFLSIFLTVLSPIFAALFA